MGPWREARRAKLGMPTDAAFSKTFTGPALLWRAGLARQIKWRTAQTHMMQRFVAASPARSAITVLT